MKKKEFTAMGLMTGTSMDGVDLSIIKSDGYSEFVAILNSYFEFDINIHKKLINLRSKILSVEDFERNFDELEQLEREITLFHAKIIQKASRDYDNEIDIVGFHGQTIYHNPELKFSKQLGNGKLLSQITKKLVVSDFRQSKKRNKIE